MKRVSRRDGGPIRRKRRKTLSVGNWDTERKYEQRVSTVDRSSELESASWRGGSGSSRGGPDPT